MSILVESEGRADQYLSYLRASAHGKKSEQAFWNNLGRISRLHNEAYCELDLYIAETGKSLPEGIAETFAEELEQTTNQRERDRLLTVVKKLAE